jgi:xylose isomerase
LPRSVYATRLNSFMVGREKYWPGKNGKITSLDLLSRAATVEGLAAVDMNYPDHLQDVGEAALSARLNEVGVALNGFAMRYYTESAFKIGAFTNPDPRIRRAAIDLTKKGLDSLAACGGRLMTLWMGQDGFDYSFQLDYQRAWEMEVEAIREVADHLPGIEISLEYKPNEPRSYALLPDVATTLLAIDEVARPNLGVTLDFAHVLYADEMPAFAAHLVARRSKLLGVHLNDGYGKRDDGLMVGTVHPLQTIELLRALRSLNYEGVIYFDTFPDVSGLDPVNECAANIATVEAMWEVVDRLDAAQASLALVAAMDSQDAVAGQMIVRQALYGR